jgi:threonine/homoserine/homoserine lactone efflux protein
MYTVSAILFFGGFFLMLTGWRMMKAERLSEADRSNAAD